MHKSNGGAVGFVYFRLNPAHVDMLPLMKCRLNNREVLPGDICCIGMLKTVLPQLGMRGGGPNNKSSDVLL